MNRLWRDHGIPLAFLAPSLILLAVFAFYPMVHAGSGCSRVAAGHWCVQVCAGSSATIRPTSSFAVTPSSTTCSCASSPGLEPR